MAERLSLMAVHAHPDDESIGTGGILARYADEGLHTVLVTCTGGEVGEIADASLASPESLGRVRERELRQACEILGVGALHLLGYRDSGMVGTPDNDHPASFYRASLDEATERLVAIMRRERPQVVVTYDEVGFYGHPDHVRANQVTVAAFDAAPDPVCYPEAGPPWQPRKLYYTAVPRSRVLEFERRLLEAGISPPFEPAEGEPPPFGTPDDQVTTFVDVTAEVQRKHRALLAHATQIGPEVFFAQLPPELFASLFNTESFQLVRWVGGRLDGGVRDDDLFAGLR